MKRMEAFFAKQNYQIQGNAEKDFQYAMSIILQLLSDSLTIYTEGTTSEGRIDILAQAPRFVYIIELKINDTVEAALQQIDQKGYARRFADDPRPLFKIGIRFSTRKKTKSCNPTFQHLPSTLDGFSVVISAVPPLTQAFEGTKHIIFAGKNHQNIKTCSQTR